MPIRTDLEIIRDETATGGIEPTQLGTALLKILDELGAVIVDDDTARDALVLEVNAFVYVRAGGGVLYIYDKANTAFISVGAGVGGDITGDTVTLNGATNLRLFNARAGGSNARVYLEGSDDASVPGIEVSINDNSKAIIRGARQGTDGVEWQIYNEADGGALTKKWSFTADDFISYTNGDITTGGTVNGASAADLTKLSELTATSTELNYVDGVTSNIQTQLDAISDTDDQTAAEVPYSNATSGLTATDTQAAIDEILDYDGTLRTVAYVASITDTYDETAPNFKITTSGNLTLAIGSITEGGGIVNIIRGSYDDTITLTGNSAGNHNYPKNDLTIRLTYFYENGEVVWYCNNPDYTRRLSGSGRANMTTTNDWVTNASASQGTNREDFSETGGTGVDPLATWTKMGNFVEKGTIVDEMELRARVNNSEVTEVEIIVYKVITNNDWDTANGMSNDGDMTRTELFRDDWFNISSGTVYTANTNQHRRKLTMSTTADANIFEDDGYLEIWYKPTGTITSTRYFEHTYSYKIR